MWNTVWKSLCKCNLIKIFNYPEADHVRSSVFAPMASLLICMKLNSAHLFLSHRQWLLPLILPQITKSHWKWMTSALGCRSLSMWMYLKEIVNLKMNISSPLCHCKPKTLWSFLTIQAKFICLLMCMFMLICVIFNSPVDQNNSRILKGKSEMVMA